MKMALRIRCKVHEFYIAGVKLWRSFVCPINLIASMELRNCKLVLQENVTVLFFPSDWKARIIIS